MAPNIDPPRPTLRARLGALRTLPPFLALIWRTSPSLTSATLALRLVRALLPVAVLFLGKLIIDEVLHLSRLPGHPPDAAGWIASGLLLRLALLILAELALAVLTDVLGRVVSLVDALLAERFTNASSIRLMQHAATLDLEDFEDSELQDKLDRARRQTGGRTTLISQMFGQAQDVVTVVGFAAGLAAYAPWLIVLLLLALIPAFLGEAHFNAQGYALSFARTAERRELDYVRQTGASTETAKEVKIFGLNDFLIDRYRQLSLGIQAENRQLALRRAGWGGALAALGTVGYYIAYAYLAWRTLSGGFSIGDLTFLAGSFMRLRGLLEGLLAGFSSLAGPGAIPGRSLLVLRSGAGNPLARASAPLPGHGRRRVRLRGRRLPLPRRRALGGPQPEFYFIPRRDPGLGRRERRRQDDAGKVTGAIVRPR